MDFSKKLIAASTIATLLAMPMPAMAERENEPTAGEMTADVVVARPIGTVVTVLGAAAFVASLPFSLMGGNTSKAAQQLVVKPAKTTFWRCLGCKMPGRYSDPDRVR